MTTATEFPGVAVVTGAASGMGRTIAQTFARSGCPKVALLDINTSGLDKTKADMPSSTRVVTYVCDISKSASVEDTFAMVFEEFGRIDYLVNAAGIMVFNQPTAESSIESFDNLFSINYRGLWLCSRAALQRMATQPLDSDAYPHANIPPARAQRGSIVNIASTLGVIPMAGSPAYCAAKAGVLSLTRSDAVDYSPSRIRVNAVMPGLIDTPMTAPTAEVSAMLQVVAESQAPMRRKGTSQEVADVVLFLSGNKASFVQGASWAVDGGNLAEKR